MMRHRQRVIPVRGNAMRIGAGVLRRQMCQDLAGICAYSCNDFCLVALKMAANEPHRPEPNRAIRNRFDL